MKKKPTRIWHLLISAVLLAALYIPIAVAESNGNADTTRNESPTLNFYF